METLIKRLERSTFIQAALYVVIGLLIILYPRIFFDAIVYLVAAYFAIIGLVALIVFFFAETLASLLPIFIGALFLFGGIIRLIQAVGFRRTIANRWMYFMLSSLLWIGIGLLMLANPFDSLLVLFQLFGGFLIAVGVIEWVLYFTLRSSRRQQA